MPYIVIVAVVGVLLLHVSGAIPLSSVGGPIVIALAVFLAALAVAILEAWTKRRSVLGWIVTSGNDERKSPAFLPGFRIVMFA